MGRCTKGKRLGYYFVTRTYSTSNQRKMNSCRTRCQSHHPFVPVNVPVKVKVRVKVRVNVPVNTLDLWSLATNGTQELFEFLFKPRYIRSQRSHPVRIEGLCNIFLFQSSVTHVSQTQIDPFSHSYIFLQRYE